MELLPSRAALPCSVCPVRPAALRAPRALPPCAPCYPRAPCALLLCSLRAPCCTACCCPSRPAALCATALCAPLPCAPCCLARPAALCALRPVRPAALHAPPPCAPCLPARPASLRGLLPCAPCRPAHPAARVPCTPCCPARRVRPAAQCVAAPRAPLPFAPQHRAPCCSTRPAALCALRPVRPAALRGPLPCAPCCPARPAALGAPRALLPCMPCATCCPVCPAAMTRALPYPDARAALPCRHALPCRRHCRLHCRALPRTIGQRFRGWWLWGFGSGGADSGGAGSGSVDSRGAGSGGADSGVARSPLVGGVGGVPGSGWAGVRARGAGSGDSSQSLPVRPFFLERPSSSLPESALHHLLRLPPASAELTATGTTPLLFQPPDSPLTAPARYSPLPISLTERRVPVSYVASPATSRVARTPVVLPLPPPSSLLVVPDPVSDLPRAASLIVPCCLATLVTAHTSSTAAASTLVAELAGFAATCCHAYLAGLVSASSYPTSIGGAFVLGCDVLEDRQLELEYLPYPISIRTRYFAPRRHHPEHWWAARRVLHYLVRLVSITKHFALRSFPVRAPANSGPRLVVGVGTTCRRPDHSALHSSGRLDDLYSDRFVHDSVPPYWSALLRRLFDMSIDDIHSVMYHVDSSTVAASCSFRSLTHPSVLWHHSLGHPSLPRIRHKSRHGLVSSVPHLLPSLPPLPVMSYTPCIKGRLRATPHSSFLAPATTPLRTLHLDDWGSAPVAGSRQKRFFLVVTDNFSR
ncbi:unnamed protein product [Closterium sp. NIES-54]